MSQAVSALGPIDPSSIPDAENEKHAPWIVRKLVGSMTGRIVMSSYETLRSAGTSVICLSPWGDSSPLLLPCIRFRDLAIHAAIVATGGAATVAAPVMGPVTDVVIGTFGDTIAVELAEIAGYEVAVRLGDELISHGISNSIPMHSKVLETTSVKTMTITLKYKHAHEDANLGFFRSGLHSDSSLFSSVKDYLAIEKGWFSPYLFASGRRPAIPRSMTPDIVFCHGPFLQGDYRVGETMLAQSANSIILCPGVAIAEPEISQDPHKSPSLHASSAKSSLHLPSLNRDMFTRSRTPSPEPQLTPLPTPAKPRRLVIVVVGLKPHRVLWTTSARPEESVIQYQLLNGCPAIVVPVKVGAPLLAWAGITLEQMWQIEVPKDDQPIDLRAPIVEGNISFQNVVAVLYEFLDLCVDWERMEYVGSSGEEKKMSNDEEKRAALKEALTLLVAAAVRSGESKAVKKDIDKERAGIAMWRIP
ncbi:hypothetical protein PUNSTDRAFT_120371 [Punctularia strigosozonata HHB-11173 SS5]|uniref:uncharacterized protein n=1 Tax=Punctularia strigosozonata (strain HHB-11173) TaxID=741275 RepID=UPI000441644E|nr:uncharacterized protein PUNSTDRAFT_120371 [Punctularia strigosozonata HHB-11173 SS5]EIN08796.1 hypothetical protein PUNSTDRAFT_120371 [Punctularia strigosozonata HHB-11173 SS5]